MPKKLFALALLLTLKTFPQTTSSSCPSITQPTPSLVNGDSETCLIAHSRQVDTWLLSANAGDWIVLTATKIDQSDSFFPAIALIGPDGQTVTGALGHHNVALIGVSAPLSGTYSVQISSNAGQGGNPLDGTGAYSLVLAQGPESFDVPKGDDGGPMINGHSHQGVITVGDIDMWSFQANQGDWLFLSIGKLTDDNGLFWPNLQLIDPNGQLVKDAHGSSNVAQINMAAPTTGTYTVLVSSDTGQGGTPFDGAGSYSLTLAEAPEAFFVFPGDDGGTLQAGSGNIGTIDVGDIDMWSLNATAGNTISLRIDKLTDTNGEFWPNIQLIDPNGQPIVGAHNQTSAQISTQASVSGVYTVLISSNSGQGGAPFDGTGSYRITSSQAGCPVNISLSVVEALYLRASFTAPSSSKLSDYASACGFTEFNWQQVITVFPGTDTAIIPNIPANLSANVFPANCSTLLPGQWPGNDCVIVAGPSSLTGFSKDHPAFYDPPQGGYSYAGDNHHFPFYYSTSAVTTPSGFCTLSCPPTSTFPFILSADDTILSFLDGPAVSHKPAPASTSPPPGTFVAFSTSLVGVNTQGNGYPLYTWTWNSTFNGTSGGVRQTATIYPIDPGSGTGGATLTSINGVQLPPAVPSTQIAITASGLAYSRVSQTFNGTVTLRNTSATLAISGPLQLLFTGIPANVTLVNATANLFGTPYLTVSSLASLAPGQSITVAVQFKNPLNSSITLTPTVYSGSIK